MGTEDGEKRKEAWFGRRVQGGRVCITRKEEKTPARSSQEHLPSPLETGRCAAPGVRIDSGFTFVEH